MLIFLEKSRITDNYCRWKTDTTDLRGKKQKQKTQQTFQRNIAMRAPRSPPFLLAGATLFHLNQPKTVTDKRFRHEKPQNVRHVTDFFRVMSKSNDDLNSVG